MKIIVKRRTLYSPMQKKYGIWDQKSFASDVSNMKRKCNIYSATIGIKILYKHHWSKNFLNMNIKKN